MPSRRQHGSIDEAIESGCQMVEYHAHEANDNYTVHLKEGADDPESTVFTNIKPEHMQELLSKCGIAGPPRRAWTLEAGPKPGSGGRPVVPTISTAEMAGTHGATHGTTSSTSRKQNHPPAATTVDEPGPQSATTYMDCVKQGGEIVECHETMRGTYSVRIRTPDGAVHVYTSVSRDNVEGVPGADKFLDVEE